MMDDKIIARRKSKSIKKYISETIKKYLYFNNFILDTWFIVRHYNVI